jgi:uncharacterized RDD family membrane protein YckC
MKKQKISTKRLLGYRFLAYTTDFIILLVAVMTIQFGFSYLTNGVVNNSLTSSWPLYIWLLGTVTIPVYLYFILSEYSKKHATIGKRLFKLKVTSDKGNVTLRQSFIRNFVKVIIPWEATHIALLFPTPILADPTNSEFRLTLFAPYVIFAIYAIYLLATKGRKTLHDALARTNVQLDTI